MNKVNIEQIGAKEAENIQNNDMSNNIILVQNGLAYKDVKEIALDVYRNEASNFSKESAEEVKKRVEEFVDDYLTVVFNDTPDIVERLKKPSMQHALFNAEKGYALDETQTTKAYYIEMLKHRLKAEDKTILQIGLDEAIKSMEKITKEQMDCLTFMFLIFNFPHNIDSISAVIRYCNYLCDFYHSSFNSKLNVISLRAINACTSLDGTKKYIPIQEWLRKVTAGIFYKGQDKEEIVKRLQIDSIEEINIILMKNLLDPTKFQINAINLDTLKFLISKHHLEFCEDKLIQMFNEKIMNETEIKDKLIEWEPRMKEVLEFWEKEDLKYSTLTPSGIIIAISNYNNKKNETISFEKYIN